MSKDAVASVLVVVVVGVDLRSDDGKFEREDRVLIYSNLIVVLTLFVAQSTALHLD